MHVPGATPMRGYRGVGQFVGPVQSTFGGGYVLGSVSSGAGGGNYQVLSDGSVLDPTGNTVTDLSVLPTSVTNQIGNLLAGVPAPSNALASLFPGMAGNTNIAGASVPSWLIPVGLILGALVLYKGFAK